MKSRNDLMRTLIFFLLIMSTSLNAQQHLEAKAREDVPFATQKRVLHTTLKTLTDFEVQHPNWSISLKTILTDHLHTSILLNQKENKLLSFDGSAFPLASTKNALVLTNEVIAKIGAMYFGREEVAKLKEFSSQ
ncbi:MAG: hypothetical protein ACO3SY_07515 [Flavobacteriaceae bacterium]